MISGTSSRRLHRYVCGLVSVLMSAPVAAADVEFTSSDLPIVLIDTRGLAIPDEPKVTAWMGIIDNSGRRNNMDDDLNGYDGAIGIEVRGSSSQGFPKKSYSLETRDGDGENLNLPLLGMPEENDWVLHGPYSDKSLMRNVIAYWISSQMGRYATRTRFCEVVLNGGYIGVYVMVEKVKRDVNRIDIAKLEEGDNDDETVTGGYILRIDRFVEGVDGGWFSRVGLEELQPFYRYEYPKDDEITPAQQFYIQSYINELETTLMGGQFADPQFGFARYLDVPSLIDHLIVNEVAKNVDAYRLSMFMYKDRGGLLHFGPPWDFNLGFGNVNYDIHPEAEIRGAPTAGMQLNNQRLWGSFQFWFWLRRIVQDPGFVEALDSRWRELRAGPLNDLAVMAKIDELAALLGEAQERNFDRWPVLGIYVWPNYFVGETHQEEVVYLKDWLRERLAWMDTDLSAAASAITDITVDRVTGLSDGSGSEARTFELQQNFPNPFNGATTIVYSVPFAGPVRLTAYNLSGQLVAILVDGWHDIGVYDVQWSGHDSGGAGVASGVYYLKMETEAGGNATGKMTILR